MTIEQARGNDQLSASFAGILDEHIQNGGDVPVLLAGAKRPLHIRGIWRADYYDGEISAEDIDAGLGKLVDSQVGENLLTNAGIALMLDLLIGAGGTTFANGNTYIGTGDSSTAAAAGQTDLQAASNKFKRVMDATYPSRSGQTLTFRTTYSTSESNYAIQECGVFNAGAAFATGTMLNRIASSLGTKTSATTLQLTVTLTIS